ncbi:MAG: hypothetical protein ABIN61_03620 [candidate division WOR-3 bacterium]
MSKVIEKILKEAEETKRKIEEEAEIKVKGIIEKAEKEAKEIEIKGEREAEEEKKREKERILSRHRLELSKRKLEEKNKIMNELKEKVVEEIKKLKWEEYRSFVENLILKASENGSEEILPGLLHIEKVKELIRSMNEEKKCKFKISEETPDFDVGIVMVKGRKKIDATLPTILEEVFDKSQEELIKILF